MQNIPLNVDMIAAVRLTGKLKSKRKPLRSLKDNIRWDKNRKRGQKLKVGGK